MLLNITGHYFNSLQQFRFLTYSFLPIFKQVLSVCHEIKKKFLDFPPTLVIEILSPATALKDRHTKFEIYQQQKIRYYLIVSPEEEMVEVYELEDEEYVLRIKEHAFNYNFTLDNCNTSVDFNEIW